MDKEVPDQVDEGRNMDETGYDDTQWENVSGGFRRRVYPDYNFYLNKQKQKLRISRGDGMQEYNAQRSLIEKHMKTTWGVFLCPGMTVLCLGARMGGEVQGFIEQGCFAVGIDLYPGDKNRYVVHGDFHSIQFPDASIDAIYTNSIDHVLELDVVIGEMLRVLKPDGYAIIECKAGYMESGTRNRMSDGYDCFEWPTCTHLVNRFNEAGFKERDRYRGGRHSGYGIVYQKAVY